MSSSGTAELIAEKRHGVRRVLKYLGSAHTEADPAVLMQVAWEKLSADHGALDLEVPVRGRSQGPRQRPARS
jgi:hypothetical protein